MLPYILPSLLTKGLIFQFTPIHLPGWVILHHPWKQPHPTVSQVGKTLLFGLF